MDETIEQAGCVPNINAAQRRMRLISGIVMLVTGLVVLLVMAALDLDPLWRLALYPIFVGAATGYFQWREKTWVGLAARGSRILDNGLEQIEDADELGRVRQQSSTVMLKSALLALPITLLALLVWVFRHLRKVPDLAKVWF